MNLMGNFTIKQRLLNLVIITIVFFIGFSILSSYGLRQVESLVNTIYDHPYKVTTTSYAEEAKVREIHISMLNYLAYKDKVMYLH